MRLRTLLALGAACLPLGACSDQPTAPSDAGAIQIRLATLPAGPYRCGQAIPVSATVTSSRGKAVAGLLLNFNVLSGGGSIFGGAALTDSRGVAADIWTLGRPDVLNTMAIRTVSSGGTPTTYDSATVTPLSRLAWVSGFDIWVMNSDGTNKAKLIDSPGGEEADYPTWSPDGSQLAYEHSDSWTADMYVINADGTGNTRLTTDGVRRMHLAWSPDGGKIAFTQGNDIYVMDLATKAQTQLTNAAGFDEGATWSPDGSRIAFLSNRTGNFEVWAMNADGSGQTNLTANGADNAWPAWSPDGSKIAFCRAVDLMSDYDDIWLMNPDGSGQANLTNSPTNFSCWPTWSPDGKVAFMSDLGSDPGSNVYYYNVWSISTNGTGLTNMTHNDAYTFLTEITWTAGCPAQ